MKRLLHLALCAVIFISCIKQKAKKKTVINPYFEKAYEFRDESRFDSAFSNFNKAKDLFLTIKDSVGAGKCLVNMAYISNKVNDHFGTQEIGLQALNYLNLNDTSLHSFISSNYNYLGLSTYQLGDYEKALFFYEEALKYGKKSEDISLIINNKAKVYEEMGNYDTALKIYDKSIKDVSKNTLDYARTLNNIGITQRLKDSTYNPLPIYFESLTTRKKFSDFDGLNSSYGTLADYYRVTKPDSSFFYAEKMLLMANKINSAQDKLRAFRKLSLVAPTKYLEKYLTLLDSLDVAHNSASNKFALIRYETEKHKSNLLLAQNENIKKRNNIVQLFFVTLLLVGALIFGYFIYRKRKRQLHQEKELEVKNTELKYVKKVHDRVANKVYQVISEVENIAELDKEQILDKLDAIYEISRDISYENTTPHYEDFALKLASMLHSYKSDRVAITCEGNTASLWENVNEVSKEEIFLVLQELFTNMDKHSEASIVKLQINQEDEQINIHYYDNGIGLPDGLNFNNGLTNTVSRINAIAGTITFESKNKNGLVIQIAFPTF
ncbi:ATP-binding protein [Pedobacter namyangjuensis]|uniref:ATP-binding protein n=1 Tax=Pedobacter namyangjuensis TaxID=600626 RepID=UPI0013B45BEC|nr:tetratricopeptide repeat-containing sensor histidine kinase [Pedobacter namyangjuensis]